MLIREQRTLTREEEPRHFYDLISKRFDIIDVLKIQRKDDEHTISDKIYDFSFQTVSWEKDTLQTIVEHEGKEINNNKRIQKRSKYQ